MNGVFGRKEAVFRVALEVDFDAGLARELSHKPLERLLQSEIVHDGGAKNLRAVADRFERLSDDSLDSLHLFNERRISLQTLFPRVRQHDSDGRQNLAKLVVQVARHLPQRLLLDLDELPRKLPQLSGLNLESFRQMMQPLESLAVRLERVQAGGKRQPKQDGDHQPQLLFHGAVHFRNRLRRLGLRLVVQHQQSRHGFGDDGALGLEFGLDQRARLGVFPALGQTEHAVGGPSEIFQG